MQIAHDGEVKGGDVSKGVCVSEGIAGDDDVSGEIGSEYGC